MPDLDALLSRPGLCPELRILVDLAVRVWRADWRGVRHAAELAHARGIARSAVEETLLQVVLFCGFPRAIAAFGEVQAAWPPSTPPAGGEVPPARRGEAGRELFDGVYGDNAASVHAMLRSYHQELHDFVLDEAYGRILSRPGLPARDRELVAVGALCAMDQIPQLVAHARGALAFGADELQVREALVTALGDTDEVDVHLRRILGLGR